jgi:hypothetical protein
MPADRMPAFHHPTLCFGLCGSFTSQLNTGYLQKAFLEMEMEEPTVLRKDQLELSLHKEKKLIQEGTIKDDNPLDLSEPFRDLCSACRKGDLKVCQEKITEGVNVNARDLYDYTPLILVGAGNRGKRTSRSCS